MACGPCGRRTHACDARGAAMTQRLMRACVIGAGLAGLCCALAAASRGLRVQLLDEAAGPRALAAHIEVVPSMLRDLVTFGVGDDCVRAGFPYRGIDVIDRHGRHLHQLPTEKLAGPRFPAALGIRHDELHRLLERAALARGVALRRGAHVRAVHERAGGAQVEIDGGELLEADLVVLATGTGTGTGSALSLALFPPATPAAELCQSWWYALLPRPVDLDRPLIAYGGAGRRAVLVPVRHDQAGLALTEQSAPPPGVTPAAHLRRALSAFAAPARTGAAACRGHADHAAPGARRVARSPLAPRRGARGRRLRAYAAAALRAGRCAGGRGRTRACRPARARREPRRLVRRVRAPPRRARAVRARDHHHRGALGPQARQRRRPDCPDAAARADGCAAGVTTTNTTT
jgi:2-polyprenyl-6-methoxyphenol hydroxylase-like FAD-dependent oxidoreductase